MQRAMSAGALTCERLVELYIARIAAYDAAEPKLRRSGVFFTLN